MQTAIKNIIFDIGNVILNYQPERFLRSKYGDAIAEELFPIIFGAPEWLSLDRGVITSDEATKIFVKACPKRRSQIEETMPVWIYHMTPIQLTVECLHNLKERGYTLYYLSNFQKEAFRAVWERYEFWSLFAGGILSCDVKLLKPEREIYLSLLRQYDLRGEECVFLDDMPANVEAAKEVGLHSILYRDPETALTELELLLASVTLDPMRSATALAGAGLTQRPDLPAYGMIEP